MAGNQSIRLTPGREENVMEMMDLIIEDELPPSPTALIHEETGHLRKLSQSPVEALSVSKLIHSNCSRRDCEAKITYTAEQLSQQLCCSLQPTLTDDYAKNLYERAVELNAAGTNLTNGCSGNELVVQKVEATPLESVLAATSAVALEKKDASNTVDDCCSSMAACTSIVRGDCVVKHETQNASAEPIREGAEILRTSEDMKCLLEYWKLCFPELATALKMGEPNYGLSEKASSYVQINIFDTSVAALSERGINLRHVFKSYHEEFGTHCHNPYVGDNSYGTEQDVWVSVDDCEDPSQSMSGDIKTLHGGPSFSYSQLESQCGSSEKGQIVPAVHKKSDATSWSLPTNDEFGGSSESGVTSGQDVRLPMQFTEEESPISSSRGEPVQSSTKASVHATATCYFTTTQKQMNAELANPSCVPTLPSDEGVSYLKSQFQEQKSDYTRTFSVEGLQNLVLDYQHLGAEAANIVSKEPVTPKKRIHGMQNEGYLTAKCQMPLHASCCDVFSCVGARYYGIQKWAEVVF
ncbi:unnamed protein product [Nippostrongylus brasiliensis]|uniref:RNA-binding protein 44 n=1 Tax=Nippostrongylus brasiliensis TaxID=27835 RepID=A0A0N4XCP2_NIPBR|nr:unnamed protein product [Nippostrongylus brasiliensis]